MNIVIKRHAQPRQIAKRATHPIEPRCGTQAALLLVAGTSQLPRRALPVHRIAAHSGVFNYRFQEL
jgi:hypothetical protein